ncbi:B12-binding domain-containing protein [Nocardioides sp.]|uniref:MerR family transcriptional regulator n=1 Tax=Nocardioides sp. TaxID=35761 RepID=UPI002716547E|nr:B12-binding domain-containing protein [Nocardioides sp.]MDO9458227.1 MerR family transcriptional regulator [Nocardioides sp.]
MTAPPSRGAPGSTPPDVGAGLQIHEANAFLGVPAPTLRSWELRYGLPVTLRSPGGHRRYTEAALHELGMMRDEVASGRTPAEAARRVRVLLDEQSGTRSRVEGLLAGSERHDASAIRSVLEEARAALGLAATLDAVVLPTMRQIGAWWETGRCDVDQETFTTEVVRGWLAKLTTLAPPPASDRWVLLGTGPHDVHTLGIEALGALLVTRGTGCRVLGARTPQHVVVAAVRASSPAGVVIVSHLSHQRRAAVGSLDALAATGCPTYYAGNAFRSGASRREVPGTYLGERLAEAATTIERALPTELPPGLASAG